MRSSHGEQASAGQDVAGFMMLTGDLFRMSTTQTLMSSLQTRAAWASQAVAEVELRKVALEKKVEESRRQIKVSVETACFSGQGNCNGKADDYRLSNQIDPDAREDAYASIMDTMEEERLRPKR